MQELGIDQRAIVLQEPVDAVGRPQALLVCGERHEIARRGEAFLPQPDQRRYPDRRLCLVIGGAAAVEVAILLLEHERIDGPVFLARVDDIDVGEQEYGLGRVGAAEPRDEIVLIRFSAENLHIGGRKPGIQ